MIIKIWVLYRFVSLVWHQKKSHRSIKKWITTLTITIYYFPATLSVPHVHTLYHLLFLLFPLFFLQRCFIGMYYFIKNNNLLLFPYPNLTESSSCMQVMNWPTSFLVPVLLWGSTGGATINPAFCCTVCVKPLNTSILSISDWYSTNILPVFYEPDILLTSLLWAPTQSLQWELASTHLP